MAKDQIIEQLREESLAVLAKLWQQADDIRRENVGDAVHLRGLIEISNHCRRRCGYCGLNVENRKLARYRMSQDEIMQAVEKAIEFGYGTVVLQAGEDPQLKTEWISSVVSQIKSQTPLAVTLSLGERPDGDLASWRQAGADRYLLRFETSNPKLFAKIHPPAGRKKFDRIAMLRRLAELGYEVGSGVMIGIPGQTYADLADDILLFAELNLDMIGVAPYISHPTTKLGMARKSTARDQVPNTELMTYKVIALARIVCPRANIPSTTALATINKQSGRELGLQRGANIVMPNLTPVQYRAMYEIYPAKACIAETADQCHACLKKRILSIGRKIGTGRGDSKVKRC